MLPQTSALVCVHLIPDLANCVLRFVASRDRNSKCVGECGEYETCQSLTLALDVARATRGASRGGHFRIVKLLACCGPTFNIRAIRNSCEAGQQCIAQYLLDRAASFGAREELWNAALFGACRGGHERIALWAVANGASSWDCGLAGACRGGSLLLAERMVAKGATSWDRGLAEAARGGHRALMRLMVQHCAHRLGDAFRYACRGGHRAIAEPLLDDGFVVEGLFAACRGAHVALARFLMTHTLVLTHDWPRCLYHAACGGSVELVQLALNKGAKNFDEALTGACYRGRHDVVKLLLAEGATRCGPMCERNHFSKKY